MDMKKTKAASSSSFDQMFGPKGSASASSPCSTILDSIFPPPVARKKGNHTAPEFQSTISQNDERSNNRGIPWKNENESRSHERREDSYFSSSIYYGGQQHYSPPRTDDGSSSGASQSDHQPKDTDDSTTSASRGNWWKGSLYY